MPALPSQTKGDVLNAIDPVRGMRDVLPDDVQQQIAVAGRIERVLASYGYDPIDLPIIEQRDLYLRKLGEELVGKTYEFNFNGRELALRPEWTASVLRAYVGRMSGLPLPLRLRYAGPVFRNERPQRHTFRQFTQVGVELIGGPAPRADAECLALACAGLDAAGVGEYRVRVGHIGLLRQVLAELGLAERTQSILVWSLERMRKQGVAAVREQLAALHGDALPFDTAQLEGLNDGQAEALLLHALHAMNVNLRYGTRPPEEIVGRLVRKLRREDQQPQVERALDLLEQLSRVQGPPAAALPAVGALLDGYGLTTTAVGELQAIMALAVAHGVDERRLVVDMGLGRGLNYYTGTIFEIYDAGELQLAGGGRYDDLVTALGGRQAAPAIGFAYGLERVVAASAAPASVAHGLEQLLVVALDDASYPHALDVARQLRQRGRTVVVDVRGRSATLNSRDAERRGLAGVVMVSAAEAAGGLVRWRGVRERDERLLSIEALADTFEQRAMASAHGERVSA
jgi:histidyl-tRNA synthetase